MTEVLRLQIEGPETPDEEKGSKISVIGCHSSHVSVALCFVK